MADLTLATGLEIGGELLGAVVKTISGLVDLYGNDDPQVQGVTSSLLTLLGAEAASEVTQRLELEQARKVAEAASAATLPAPAPVLEAPAPAAATGSVAALLIMALALSACTKDRNTLAAMCKRDRRACYAATVCKNAENAKTQADKTLAASKPCDANHQELMGIAANAAEHVHVVCDPINGRTSDGTLLLDLPNTPIPSEMWPADMRR